VAWETVVFKRDRLYEEVWSEPMRTLAARYGLSDIGLAKICRKLDIPVPGRGHWARKAAGQEIPRTPLPPHKPGRPRQHVSARRTDAAPPPICEDAERMIERERDPGNAVIVPDVLTDPHPFVRLSMTILRRAEYRARFPATTEERCLDVDVTERTRERALRVMNALLRALESRGFETELTEPGRSVPHSPHDREPSRTGGWILGEFVEFGIMEKANMVENAPAPAGSYDYRPRYGLRPNGKLAFRIRNSYPSERNAWRDSTCHRVEDRVNVFIAAMIAVAEQQRQRAQETASAEKEALERRRAAEVEERRNAATEILGQDLNQRIRDWRTAEDIRAFVRLVMTNAGEGRAPLDGATLDDWQAWALKHANELCRRAVTGLLDREHEVAGRSAALASRLGWCGTASTATLLSIVRDPTMPSDSDTHDGRGS
jgi:hypothetical protein